MRAEIFSEHEKLDAVLDAWDALACAQASPCVAPAWGLAWWRHAAPAGAELRVVVVRDGDQVVGVAPLYCETAEGVLRYGFLADQVSSPVTPVARDGAAEPVAAAVAGALAAARPRPDVVVFGNVSPTCPWPALLRDHWPGRGRPLVLRWERNATPYLDLPATFDEWLAGRSRNFRQQLRRHRRRLEAGGASFRMVTDTAELRDRLDDFAQLHHARFEGRGGSAVLDSDVLNMLADAGARMLAGARMRLWVIEVGDKVISAHLLLAAGGRVTYWLGGFDDAWAAEQPALQTLAAALGHAAAAGDRVFDLGPGLQDYKLRFSERIDPGLEVLVVPPGRGRTRTLAHLLPPRLREATDRRARAAVPPAVKDALRPWVRRLRGGRSPQDESLV